MQVPGSGPVSLGCTWFHGVLGHPLYELALQEGLLQQDVRLSRAAMKEGPSWKVGTGRGGTHQLCALLLRHGCMCSSSLSVTFQWHGTEVGGASRWL
jgi:hypothetical protein